MNVVGIIWVQRYDDSRSSPEMRRGIPLTDPFSCTRIFLIQPRKKWYSRAEKGPSRNAFPLSTYVVLKTTYVNPNDYARSH